MKCPNCGNECDESLGFCDSCGTDLPENPEASAEERPAPVNTDTERFKAPILVKCPACGASNHPDSELCNLCSAPIAG